jgi:uncharacterized NAD(P)/FAD-binding protein YdhS
MLKKQGKRYSSYDITIAGGGASGTLLLIHLLRELKSTAKIILVNNRYPVARGIAYSTTEKEHLLNVRAGRMSAFPDDPDDFINWILRNPELSEYHQPGIAELFIPRAAYGDYLEQRLEQAILNTAAFHDVDILEDEITDLEKEADHFVVLTASGENFETKQLILATGNTPPEELPGNIFRGSDQRIRVDPWEKNGDTELHPEHDIMVLGSSLTMADRVLSLLNKKFRGKIIVLSRHGKLPVTHPAQRLHSQDPLQIQPEPDLNLVYRQIKERIRDVIHESFWQEPVLEAIRPHTQNLWQQLSLEQKQRFLRHLNHRWSILRHRIPAEVSSRLAELTLNGQLSLHAGQLILIKDETPLLKVQYRDRQSGELRELQVQRIYNCTGPEGNLEKASRPLIKNLLKRGFIRPDALRLGFDAEPDGRIIGREGEISTGLFTLGPGLRGILWESTAVPEIRVQAVNLSRILG